MSSPEPTTHLSGLPDVSRLQEGWTARVPGVGEVAPIVALADGNRELADRPAGVDPREIEGVVAGSGSWTRHQAVLVDPDGEVRGWAQVHDRAAGRTNVEVLVTVDLPAETADVIAEVLFDWVDDAARVIETGRGLTSTVLDCDIAATDTRLPRWLERAAYAKVRTWLQMTRPVTPAEGEPGALPEPRAGVRVRRVERHENGMPFAADLQTVHRMLEESFEDHFNSYRESFPEFLSRLREAPGHRWDLWWIAEIETDDGWEPGGAVAASLLGPDASGAHGTYLDYIGVHRRARGRGVAKALLHTVVREAARDGHNRVLLEVDADSPTGADGLYTALGWQTYRRTTSWHKEVTVPTP